MRYALGSAGMVIGVRVYEPVGVYMCAYVHVMCLLVAVMLESLYSLYLLLAQLHTTLTTSTLNSRCPAINDDHKSTPQPQTTHSFVPTPFHSSYQSCHPHLPSFIPTFPHSKHRTDSYLHPLRCSCCSWNGISYLARILIWLSFSALMVWVIVYEMG